MKPDGKNWEEFEKLIEKWKDEIPDKAMKKLKEQMEKLRENTADVARGAADRIDPRIPGANQGTVVIKSVNKSGRGYRVTMTKGADGPGKVSLYKADGTPVFEDVPMDQLEERIKDLPAEAQQIVKTVMAAKVKIQVNKDPAED
jgi:hypothetical protein